MSNRSLHNAKMNKNDEFYTRLEDIENEVHNYTEHFEDKVVYCNCDDPEKSYFWKYFHLNFSKLKLKKLVASYYDAWNPVYFMEYDGGNDSDTTIGIKTNLMGNGDFRSFECIELLFRTDIVVSNPPFSLARQYIDLLVSQKKDFLIIGDINWISYKQTFSYIMNNIMWLGCTHVKEFITPEGETKKFGNKLWFTTLDHLHRHEPIPLTHHYTPNKYPKYDNYDAINVDRVSEIPCDYYEDMGVPISYIEKYDPDQFRIVRFRYGEDNTDLRLFVNSSSYNVNAERESLSNAISAYNNTSSTVRKSGIIGVPASFLERYCPEQFKIVGASMYDATPCRIHRDYSTCKRLKHNGSPSISGALKDRTTPKVYGNRGGDYAILQDGTIVSATYNRIFITYRSDNI